MCESNAYLKSNNREELILEEVVMMIPEPGKVTLTNLLGDKKVIEGEIDHIDFLKHRIVLKSK